MAPSERRRGGDASRGAEALRAALEGLREIDPEGRVGPGTAVYGLIGPHVEADRVREYNAAFRTHGIDAVAAPLVVPEDGDAVAAISALRARDVRGYHIHPPHQEAVGQALDELDASACRAGKVNAVYTKGGALVGAWVETPAEQFKLWTGRDLVAGAAR